MRLPPCSSLARNAVPQPLHLTSMATATPFHVGQSLREGPPRNSVRTGSKRCGWPVEDALMVALRARENKRIAAREQGVAEAADRLALGRNPGMRRLRSFASWRTSSGISSHCRHLHGPPQAIPKIGTAFATKCFDIRSLGSGPGERCPACRPRLKLPPIRILIFQLESLPCSRSAVIRAVCC